MFNEASPLDPKSVNNWLDLDNLEHIKAFKQVTDGKFWPEGFIADEIKFPSLWQMLIANKITERWLKRQIEELEAAKKPCEHVCPTCNQGTVANSTSPHCLICDNGA